MIRLVAVCVVTGSMLALTACAEKPQQAATRKPDTQAWQASGSAYRADGWKEGDRSSWEEQLRTRAQGQNDYAKVK